MKFSEHGVPILPLRDKLDGLNHCLAEGEWEDAAGHLCDLLELCRRKIVTHDGMGFVDLAAMAGALAGMLADFTSSLVAYQPHDWKGNLEKAECARRVKQRLSPDELAAVTLPKRKALAHNVWDAVGIGLRYLNRFGPNS